LTKKVSIIDYGVGNIFSVSNAIKAIGSEPCFVSTFEEVQKSQILILPGVGAFPSAIQKLEALQLVEPIREYANSGKKLIGICLGMQLFFTSSEEMGLFKGLDLISGTIKENPSTKDKDHLLPKTNIGWQKLDWRQDMGFHNLKKNSYYYFVHSFSAIPELSKNTLATIKYGNVQLTAAVKKENIIGFQFHPERSGESGLKLLNTAINL